MSPKEHQKRQSHKQGTVLLAKDGNYLRYLSNIKNSIDTSYNCLIQAESKNHHIYIL